MTRPATVAKISEISAFSPKSFQDAVEVGIDRAVKTLKHVKSAWVAEQHVVVENDEIAGYRVNLKVTFVLAD